MVNGPATEVALVEAAEEIEDAFAAFTRTFHPQLRRVVTLLDSYRQERQILRALDRRGLDSEWAKRALSTRRNGGDDGNEPEAA